MSEPEPPSEPVQEPAAHVEPAPQTPDPTWAAGVSKSGSGGPAGWPGAVLSSAHVPQTDRPVEFLAESPIEPMAQAEPLDVNPVSPLARTELPTSMSQEPLAQPTLFETSIAPPPPAPVVQEVEAVPLQASEKRGPTIDAPPVRARAAEPQPASPSFASAPIPPAPSAGAAQTSSMPPPPSPPSGAIPPQEPALGADARTPPKKTLWAVLCHLAFLLPIPPHISGIIVTILIWVWRRRSDAFVEDQGREALNFQLTYLALSAVLVVVPCIGFVLIPVVWIVGAVLCIVAAARAHDGVQYRYPLIFRLIG
jgi:uncharacterized Tic20 family protein